MESGIILYEYFHFIMKGHNKKLISSMEIEILFLYGWIHDLTHGFYFWKLM